MDSDAYALSNLAEATITAFEASSDLGAMAFALVGDKGEDTGATSPEPTILGLLLGQRLDTLLTSPCIGSVTLHSCAIAIRKSAFDAVGGFDEDFDFLDADIDFSMRMRAAGWRLSVNRNYRAFHTGSGSPQATDKRVLRYHRNRLLLLAKHRGKVATSLLIPALFLRHCAEIVVLALLLPWQRFNRKVPARLKLAIGVWRRYEL
jgi:GT2 family glycosyltransferase